MKTWYGLVAVLAVATGLGIYKERSRKTLVKTKLAAATLAIGYSAAAPALGAATPPVGSDWITKDVCADSSNTPVAADPYGGCPAGTTERDIAEGEELPYYNHDQPDASHPNGYQRRDAYPITDLSGNPLVVSELDFDYFKPYGTFEAGDGDGRSVGKVADRVTGGGSDLVHASSVQRGAAAHL